MKKILMVLILLSGCAGNQYEINGGLCDYRDSLCSFESGSQHTTNGKW